MHTLTAKELETVAKYYSSSSDNSSKYPGRKNGVGAICYPTTYYGQGGTITVGITVLGTIGIIYSGFLFMTARKKLNTTINTPYSKNIDQSNNQPPHSA